MPGFSDAPRPGRPPLPVAVAIPVRNEEANISACLERLGRFDEVFLIDSQSTDRTARIAEEFGATVLQFSWDGGYPKKRNWFLLNGFTRKPWVLFLDADEYVSDEFCDELERATADDGIAGYWIDYDTHFMGRRLRHGIRLRKLALFRVGAGLYEDVGESGRWSRLDMEVHEHPVISGQTGLIAARIDHRDYKGLGHYLAKHVDYAMWESQRYRTVRLDADQHARLTRRQRLKYKNISKWWYPWAYLLLSLVAKGGFRDGSAGFHFAFYKAWYFHSIRLMIRENSPP